MLRNHSGVSYPDMTLTTPSSAYTGSVVSGACVRPAPPCTALVVFGHWLCLSPSSSPEIPCLAQRAQAIPESSCSIRCFCFLSFFVPSQTPFYLILCITVRLISHRSSFRRLTLTWPADRGPSSYAVTVPRHIRGMEPPRCVITVSICVSY